MSYRENYKLIDWSKPLPELPRKAEIPVARSDLPCPLIISDSMDETEHPCDGKVYTSKSTFRRVTKANGCIEVGNDAQRFRIPKKPTADKAGIDRAIERALSRV